MKQFIYFIVIIICALLLGSCNHIQRKEFYDLPNIDESIESDSVELEQWDYVPTVAEVLKQRADAKHSLWVDSVYLNMPEQIVTHMLVNKGTTISITEIVEDYINNKQYYHDTILKTMNIQKKYIPDSIPKTGLPEEK